MIVITCCMTYCFLLDIGGAVVNKNCIHYHTLTLQIMIMIFGNIFHVTSARQQELHGNKGNILQPASNRLYKTNAWWITAYMYSRSYTVKTVW